MYCNLQCDLTVTKLNVQCEVKFDVTIWRYRLDSRCVHSPPLGVSWSEESPLKDQSRLQGVLAYFPVRAFTSYYHFSSFIKLLLKYIKHIQFHWFVKFGSTSTSFHWKIEKSELKCFALFLISLTGMKKVVGYHVIHLEQNKNTTICLFLLTNSCSVEKLHKG